MKKTTCNKVNVLRNLATVIAAIGVAIGVSADFEPAEARSAALRRSPLGHPDISQFSSPLQQNSKDPSAPPQTLVNPMNVYDTTNVAQGAQPRVISTYETTSLTFFDETPATTCSDRFTVRWEGGAVRTRLSSPVSGKLQIEIDRAMDQTAVTSIAYVSLHAMKRRIGWFSVNADPSQLVQRYYDSFCPPACPRGSSTAVYTEHYLVDNVHGTLPINGEQAAVWFKHILGRCEI